MTALERKVLNTAVDGLVEPYRSVLQAQVDELNYVQRHAGGRDTYLYRVEGGVRLSRKSPPVDVGSREFRWATVRIRDRQTNRSLTAQIWLLNGRVANLVFSASPAKWADRRCEFTIAEMAALDQEQTAWRRWANRLPPDLAEAAERSTADQTSLSFCFPGDTYEVVLPQGDFIVIGEVPDVGMLVAAAGAEARKDGVYLAPLDGKDPKYLGATCEEASRLLTRRGSVP
jgi:hypothetical protein